LFVGKFKRSNIVTVQAQNAYSAMQEEFETFKKRAREKEQMLKRELQNELNTWGCVIGSFASRALSPNSDGPPPQAQWNLRADCPTIVRARGPTHR
jgi:hypothetical protein